MTRELRQLCNHVRQLADTMRKQLTLRVADTAAKLVAIYMFAKAYKSYQAALFLYRGGFWQDAASVARTVQELSFQARWLEKDPETAGELFLRGEERDRTKLLKNLTVAGSRDIGIQADALLKELQSSTDVDFSWRNWWGKDSNIEKLANEVGYARVYGLQYRHLSWFVHSSPISIRYYLSDDSEVPPDYKASAPQEGNEEFAEACFSAAPAALMDVLAVVDNMFELNLQKEFDRVAPAFQKFNEAGLAAEKSTEEK